MTEIKVNGGASVHRAYTDGGSEFLACFQYSHDAREFAGTKLLEDAERGWFESFYIIANHYDGSLIISRHAKQAAEKESA